MHGFAYLRRVGVAVRDRLRLGGPGPAPEDREQEREDVVPWIEVDAARNATANGTGCITYDDLDRDSGMKRYHNVLQYNNMCENGTASAPQPPPPQAPEKAHRAKRSRLNTT